MGGVVTVFAVVAFAYVAIHPQDVTTLAGPIDALVGVFGQILGLTNAISAWLHGVLAVALAGGTALRLRGVTVCEGPPQAIPPEGGLPAAFAPRPTALPGFVVSGGKLS